MCSKRLHKETEANYMTCDKQTKCPEDDQVQTCFFGFALLSSPNFKFMSCRQVIKREDGCAIPAARRPRIDKGARYKELEEDSPLPRENQNESAFGPLTSRKQHWNDIVTFFSL